MNKLIEKIEDLLQQYGFTDYFDPAERISEAIPWRFREGVEKYDNLYELMNLAIDLKCPTTKCEVGSEIVDESFRHIFLKGIKEHLKKELGKGNTENYKQLYRFVSDSIDSGWGDEEYQTLFLMEDLVAARLDSLGKTYDNTPEDEFSKILQDAYQYILQHPEDVATQPDMNSLRADAANRDIWLLKICLLLFEVPSIPGNEVKRYKEWLRKTWALILGQGVVSNILNAFYVEIAPIAPGSEDSVSFTGDETPGEFREKVFQSHTLIIPTGGGASEWLPYPIESPEYQYVESLYKTYNEPFDDHWAHSEYETALKSGSISYDEMPLWDTYNEKRDLNYLVTQYLHYCLTLSFFPEAGNKTMIEIGSIIYDLLCLLEYRKDKSELYMRMDNVSQKEKYDLVKRYLAIDPTTGRYKRVK